MLIGIESKNYPSSKMIVKIGFCLRRQLMDKISPDLIVILFFNRFCQFTAVVQTLLLSVFASCRGKEHKRL